MKNVYGIRIIRNTKAVFPTERNCNRVPAGPDDSLSSVLLYSHVLYKGKDVRMDRILLFCSITTTGKSFQHQNDYSALLYWGNTAKGIKGATFYLHVTLLSKVVNVNNELTTTNDFDERRM